MTSPCAPPAFDVLPRRNLRLSLGVAGLAAALPVLLGAPLGLLWAAVAPRLELVVASASSFDVPIGQTTTFIEADGTFVLLGLVAGIACGIGAWLLGRSHGPYVVVGLALGCAAAAFVAAEVGAMVGQDDFSSALRAGTVGSIDANVRLLAREALVAWPVGAMAAYVVAELARIPSR